MNDNAFTFFLGLTDQNGHDILQGLGRDNVRKKIAKLFAAYDLHCITITPSLGLWNGTQEVTWQIFVDGIDLDNARALASNLAYHFNQEAVGVRPERPLFLVSNPNSL